MVVINPETIISQLDAAKETIQNYLKAGKEVLFVAPQAGVVTEIVDLAAKHGFHYLNDKVPSGFLTNFDVLKQRIAAMNSLSEFVESNAFEKMTKKEKDDEDQRAQESTESL